MTATQKNTMVEELEFAPSWDQPVSYMQRTRSYYLGLGYENPYVWAHYLTVPFSPLKKPLRESTLALITTAAPYQADKGNQGPGSAYNALAKFYEVYSGPTTIDSDLRISHVGVDRKNADMAEMNAWFPLAAARRAVASMRLGALSPRFYGLPSNRSQRHTLEVDAPAIASLCKADGVDVAILIPNCPICHQCQSLLARYLEEQGIATVIMGAAKDIVEYCGVPRLLFSDFPLGNAAAIPNDVASQDTNFELALRILESAPAPRTTVQSPLIWSTDAQWKLDYSNIERLSPTEIKTLREEAEKVRIAARDLRIQTVGS
ncbi:reductase [Polynucleobacter sp. IMCC30063]|uniref:reductase n=1 Tax=Polynucleobacter sp. IMCC30063 TaxID=2907298 RepID=UPI001F2CB6EB|nr:reductase [Polynucleobacter sp. IMCC30063]MCE7505901.1 reductase [Polynucleobacter sp. IMCC30063]